MEDVSRVTLYHRRAKAKGEREDRDYRLTRVEEDQLFQKPTLLCCGGLQMNTDKEDIEQKASGYSSIGHGVLHYKPFLKRNPAKIKIDVLSVSYPLSERELVTEQHNYTAALLQGDKSPPPTAFARQFAIDHFFPLIQDSQGAPLALETIKRNLRNIHILAHSYGATFIQQAGNVLYDRLSELGFTRDQIKEAASQVLVVTVGAITPLATAKAPFTRFNILNADDTVVKNSYPVEATMKKLLCDLGLLVDAKGKKVPFFEQKNMRNTFPAKPLNIIPIRKGWGGALERGGDSPDHLVLASQPIRINMIGDVLSARAMTDTSRSDSGGINFDYPRSMARDETSHQLSTYLNYGEAPEEDAQLYRHGEHNLTLRLIASSVLMNGMNNAMQNRDSPEFVPLPAPADLLMPPGEMKYKARTAFAHQAYVEMDRYVDKINAALSPTFDPTSHRRL